MQMQQPQTPLLEQELSERRVHVESSLGSWRMEGLEPSAAMREDLAAYMDGSLDVDELVARTQARYGVE